MRLSELKEQVDNQLKNYGDSDVNVSVDVSTGENDSPHRIFADILVLDNCFNLLCEKTYDNGDSLGFKREFTSEKKEIQEELKKDLISKLEELMSYSTSPSCTKGMELFINRIKRWGIEE